MDYSWATADQLDDVCSLELAADPRGQHPQDYFAECISHGRVLLARDGEKLLGYLLYQVIWGNTAFLALLRVHPDFQRKGIGKDLVKTLEERLVNQGFASYVTSSETINTKTKRFFPDLGFANIGELQMNHGAEIFYLKKLP